MRRYVIFLILLLILAATFQLSRMARGWHYIVPASPGALLYATAFDEGTADWEQDEGRVYSAITDGVMQLGVGIAGDGIYTAAAPYFGDFDLRVEAVALEGPEANGYGVIFRQRDRANYYTFFISSDGFYRVRRVADNTGKDLSAWNQSDVIVPGLGVVNHLRVVGVGGRFQFYINDTLIALCIPDDPDAQSTPLATGECLGGTWQTTLTDDVIAFGRIGVAAEVDVNAEPGVVVAFDNVLVYGPQPFETTEE